jgi:(E)-benzylidenesuccinyl-CoA hydratase
MSIDFEANAGVATIVINRPERLNALDAEHYRLLSQAWTRVRDEPEIRVAVVTGAGDRAFSSGADMKSSEPIGGGLESFWFTQRDQLLNRGLEVWKPVIAAVNGYCLGGGMTLLLATDIRLAVPEATFGLPEVKRGLLPGNGGTQRLLEQVPHAIGMELLVTGRTMDAEEATRWGLINRVVERDQLMASAMETAQAIAANAPLAVQAAKEMALRSRDTDRATGLRLESAMNRLLRTSEDAQEGRQAFAERRDPDYQGS